MDKLINDFSPGLFIMQTIILIVLILLMKKFAWKPILDGLTAREEGIKNALEAAERARQEMANLSAKNEAMMKEARVERDNLIADAKATATQMVDDAKAKANVEAEKMIEGARKAIEAEKIAAVAELKASVASISLEIAEKVIKDELSSNEKQIALAGKYAEEINLN